MANWHRDQKKQNTVAIDDLNLPGRNEDDPFHATAKREDVTILLNAIRKLPDIRQQLLILKFVDGESNARIGRMLNRSEGAVKSLYHRTLMTLKKLLSDHPELLEPPETSDDY